MGFEINRSCTPDQAKSMRKSFEDQGVVEAANQEEVEALEAEGKMTFIDHTNSGKDSFSKEEMDDFRRTPIENFPEHQKRWEKPLNQKEQTPDWLNSEKGKILFEMMFETAELPEVDEKHLEAGTYTNLQIAMKFDDPVVLIRILSKLPGGSPASKRSVLRFVVDML